MKKIELFNSKSRLIFFTAIAIGSVVAIGQAYMLYHELVNCYPYKMMSFPSAYFYENIANVGIFIAPFVAIVAGLFLGRKKLWLATITPVILCPILFSFVFKIASVLHKWSGVIDVGRNFDEYLQTTAAQKFFSYSIWLSIVGLVVGAICSFTLSRFSQTKEFD